LEASGQGLTGAANASTAPCTRIFASLFCEKQSAQDFHFLILSHLYWILFNEMPGNIAAKVDSIGFHEILGPNGVRKSRKGWS